MTMYRIVNRETKEIFSQFQGWVEENGKMYGHCFEREEAILIANKLSSKGIPVTVDKDKVASRFVFCIEYLSLKKIIPVTIFILIALFGTLYMINLTGFEVIRKIFMHY
jgi:hypothetical protein